LYLLGWDSPSGEGLKERIDEKGLYPITVSTLMSEAEKQALLNQKIVLCRQLLERLEVLENLGFSDTRIKKISHEMNQLMKNVL
jgi:Zn-finger domain-containing protein